MRRQSGKEGLGSGAAKLSPRKHGGRQNSIQPEARHEKRMARHAKHGAQDRLRKLFPVLHQRRDQFSPGLAIGSEHFYGGLQIALQGDRGAVIERMGERRGRVNPRQPIIAQRQRREKGRGGGHGMHGGAEVVLKARQGELHGPGSSAGLLLGFEDLHLQPRLREHDGGSQPVGTGSHDNGLAGAGLHGFGPPSSGIAITATLPFDCSCSTGA